MKKFVVVLTVVLFSSISSSFASVSFSDNFNAYGNGNLVGQGTWAQTGTIATSPVQVNSGSVILGATGQDVYAPLVSPITITDGSTFYIGATLNVAVAQSGGDYFLHWTPTVGNSSIFPERIFAKSSGSGFVLGYSMSSAAAIYGSTVLSSNISYRVVFAYTGVAGLTNDTLAIYVNPTDTSVEGNNSAYLTGIYNTTSAESTTVAGINLRQGSASSAPSVIVDNLIVTTLFSEAAPVPEPSTILLGGLGLVGLFVLRRKN